MKNAEELDAIIGEFVAQRTQAENVEFFERAEVTIGPIYDIAQIIGDPHFIEREVIADYPDEEMGAFPMHHVVPRLMGTPGSIRTPAPSARAAQPRAPRARSVSTTRKYDELVRTGVVYEPGPAATDSESET